MKLAFLIVCHKNPEQINCMIKILSNPDIDFYIHVDKKCEIDQYINSCNSNVYLLPNEQRIDIKWGTFSQVQATLNLLKYANKKQYDYYWQISGQDFPLVSAKKIINIINNDNKQKMHNYVNLFISKNNGSKNSTNYDKRNEILFPEWMMKRNLKYRIIRRLWVSITGGYRHTFRIFVRSSLKEVKFYFGSSWWCISSEFKKYILNYIKIHPEYIEFFKKTSYPDESFFQTLLMNSEYRNSRVEYLHYIDWREGNSSPKTLKCEDLDKMFESGKLMARKIDREIDQKIISEICQRIQDNDILKNHKNGGYND